MLSEIIILIHVWATLLITGVIWFLQIVHYPLLQHVTRDGFSHYVYKHSQRAGCVIAPLMFLETLTAVLLLWWAPAEIPPEVVWLGLGLIVVILAVTTFLQVPQLEKLTYGFKEEAFSALVRNHWLRTVVWTLRSLLVLWILIQVDLSILRSLLML